MQSTARKRNGVHYTPRPLARFLAAQVASVFQHAVPQSRKTIRVLDPACGDGELLAAFVESWGGSADQLSLTGFDKDGQAADVAVRRLSVLDVSEVQIHQADFLARFDACDFQSSFEVVIANPPYVRTQVLGGCLAQKLANQFDLTGRVDLYQVFSIAMSHSLVDGGVLGLLTSNRFLSVKSGVSLRRFLENQFHLRQIFDLGDTRLFEAAVLPAIITAVKRNDNKDDIKDELAKPDSIAEFHRVYAIPDPDETTADNCVLEMLSDPSVEGRVETRQGIFSIERGRLDSGSHGQPWSLTNAKRIRWTQQLRATQHCTFGDLAEIKVGIKTTADKIFIRPSWESLPERMRPESALLHPLLTHHDAMRWNGPKTTHKAVLYPYRSEPGQRTVIDLSGYPRTRSYFEAHRESLEKRQYVTDAGRDWFEIWVPHQPTAWAKPKLVWPDISEVSKFFLDSTGAIVNGDCYWLTLKPGVEQDWLYLMLGVANSSIATTFYDHQFHNKLYAGRRRFMTQYVKEFPLPDMHRIESKRIIDWVKKQLREPGGNQDEQLEFLVSDCFGLLDQSIV